MATVAELESKIKKAKANSMMPEGLKKIYIEKAEKELAKLESAPKKEEKKAERKAKPAPKSKPSAKKSTSPTCEELAEKWEARRAAAKKAEKKHKTISVAEQIGDKVAQVVGKAIDDIPEATIKANPKKYIHAFEEVEESFKVSLMKLKTILGEDFNKSELLDPFEKVIGEFIKSVKEKYGK